MYDVQIDIEAAEAARDAMLRIRHSMNQHSAQHNNTLNWLEGLLSGAAAAVLDLANPLHALAPWEIWERWDFGGVARSCSATRGDVEQTRSEVRRTVEQLCHAHRGQLAPVIYDRAANMQSSLGRAHDILWTIVEMFNPGNILWLIRNPEAILDHFRGARGALAGALALVEEYTGFLDGLLAREETLIAEIIQLLAVPAIAVAFEEIITLEGGVSGVFEDKPAATSGASRDGRGNGSDRPGDISKGGDGAADDKPGTSRDGQRNADDPSQKGSTIGRKVAASASQYARYLTAPSSGSYRPYNGMDMNAIPADQRAEVKGVFQLAPAYWLNGDGSPHVECVAFVALSYSLAGKRLPFMGNANQFWEAYKNKAALGWSEIGNSAEAAGWPPQPGDIVAMTYKDTGHVAIVSHVNYHPDGSVASIEIAQGNSVSPTLNLKVENGAVDAPPSHGIQGFIRYNGS